MEDFDLADPTIGRWTTLCFPEDAPKIWSSIEWLRHNARPMKRSIQRFYSFVDPHAALLAKSADQGNARVDHPAARKATQSSVDDVLVVKATHPESDRGLNDRRQEESEGQNQAIIASTPPAIPISIIAGTEQSLSQETCHGRDGRKEYGRPSDSSSIDNCSVSRDPKFSLVTVNGQNVNGVSDADAE